MILEKDLGREMRRSQKLGKRVWDVKGCARANFTIPVNGSW